MLCLAQPIGDNFQCQAVFTRGKQFRCLGQIERRQPTRRLLEQIPQLLLRRILDTHCPTLYAAVQCGLADRRDRVVFGMRAAARRRSHRPQRTFEHRRVTRGDIAERHVVLPHAPSMVHWQPNYIQWHLVAVWLLVENNSQKSSHISYTIENTGFYGQ